jgi:hypothetical protein
MSPEHVYDSVMFIIILLFNGAPAHVGPRPPLMRFRNLTLTDNW